MVVETLVPAAGATTRDSGQPPAEYSDADLIKVVNLETEMGVGVRSGKPKYMFRPAKTQGAQGFKQVKEWADQGGGSYSPDQDDMFGCDSGFCGT